MGREAGRFRVKVGRESYDQKNIVQNPHFSIKKEDRDPACSFWTYEKKQLLAYAESLMCAERANTDADLPGSCQNSCQGGGLQSSSPSLFLPSSSSRPAGSCALTCLLQVPGRAKIVS